MKIIYQGDLHLRDGSPINRIDNYYETGLGKLQQLVDFVNEHEALLFLGGDIFDTHKVSATLVNQTIKILRTTWPGIYATLGQHDVPYHEVDILKSPMYSLLASGAISTAMESGVHRRGDGTVIHFCGWEKAVEPPSGAGFHVFLGHVSVFENQIPFYWKGEGYTPKTLKEKYPGYDLYLCGDIHIPFVQGNVIVSGSMMRQSIDQINYRPRCYLIETETMEITPLYYEIEDNVFNVPDEKVKENLELQSLVEALKASAVGKACFARDCMALAVDDAQVKQIITEIFNELD